MTAHNGRLRWVYLWADGIYSGLRAERARLCALVIIGVNERGEKHFLAIEDGVRESTQSWREVLLKRKRLGNYRIDPKVSDLLFSNSAVVKPIELALI